MESKSVVELEDYFKRHQTFIPCKFIHNYSCEVNAVTSSIPGMIAFKKIYMIMFLIKTLPKWRKIKSLGHLFQMYKKFFTRPLLFVFFNNVVSKYVFCTMKRKYRRNKPYIALGCISAACSIFVETPSRAKELSVFIAGNTFSGFY